MVLVRQKTSTPPTFWSYTRDIGIPFWSSRRRGNGAHMEPLRTRRCRLSRLCTRCWLVRSRLAWAARAHRAARAWAARDHRRRHPRCYSTGAVLYLSDRPSVGAVTRFELSAELAWRHGCAACDAASCDTVAMCERAVGVGELQPPTAH